MDEIKFTKDGKVPMKLTLREVETLTRQEVVDMRELRNTIVFVLANGIKVHIKRWAA